jgi:transcriptional regulator with XRE-family HTH domain
MARKFKPPNTSTYTGRVAAKLRELRLKRGWSVDDVRDRLAMRGIEVSAQAIYKWETGLRPVPVDVIPVIARIYGYGTAGGWLPIA